MNDLLANAIAEAKLDLKQFESIQEDQLYSAQLPFGGVTNAWLALAKRAKETKFWPIIRGGDALPLESIDPSDILSRVPAGNVREILEPLRLARVESIQQVMEMLPVAQIEALQRSLDGKSVESADIDTLARAVDASGMYSFIGSTQAAAEPWPSESRSDSKLRFACLNQKKSSQLNLVLIRVNHSCDVPAYLSFGGWNECPVPEIHVALLREWQRDYGALPACVTGDVIECIVTRPPQDQAAAMKLAAEQWIYCDDIVGQGTQSVRKLAMELWQNRQWFFWWD